MEKPKFIKEIEKFEGKERAKCGKWFIRVYGKLDNKPMVELESLQILIKELHKLEEENNNLKNELMEDMKYETELEEENRILKKNIAWYEEEEDRIREENRKLKLHIEAKDKAYTALLKDYEEIKEDRDKMKKRVKEHIIYSIKAEFIKKFGE